MNGYTIKALLIISLAVLATGCRVAIIVPTGGNVVSSNGAYNCPEASVCEFEVTEAPFSETFTAQASPGYEFEKWSNGDDHLCGKSTNPTCVVSLPDVPVVATIIAFFDSSYVMPIFKHVGIDTDLDGIRNELDEDDDNDGIFDVDDACPLDPNLDCGINEVGGIIYADTTWSADGGPILLASDVQIAEGATLTIGEGVEIRRKASSGDCARIQVFDGATLSVQGTSVSPVLLKEGVSIQSVSGVININHARLTGQCGHLLGGATMRNSVVESNTQVIFDSPPYGQLTVIEFNVIRARVALFLGDNDIFRNNLIEQFPGTSGTNNFLISIDIDSVGLYQFEDNSFIDFYAEGFRIDLGIDGTAANNYWGTTDTTVIDDIIYDRSDDLTEWHFLEYLPILTEPHPDTPTGF